MSVGLSGQGSRFFVSDSEGHVMLNDLPEGLSCLTATAENDLTDALCLQVSARSKDEISSFYLILSPKLPHSHSFDSKVKRAEQSAPGLRLRKLAGTVVDPVGAVISKADVQIYKRGKYPYGTVTTLETNEAGRFEASLEPGVYTVIFRMYGFGKEFLEIEISPHGSETEVRETLQVVTFDNCQAGIED